MTAENFQRALARVLVHEGGYVNHPRDPGGVTLEGVIQRVYDGYRRSGGQAPRPLTPAMRGTPQWKAERDAIYRRQYWDVIKGDRLPAGVDYVVFDGAVNSGPSQSVKWLQRALRMNRVDGELGEATVAAALAHPDHDQLVAGICAQRMAFLRQISTFGTFGRGWTARVSGVKAVGQAWATGSVGPETVAVEGSGQRALLVDAKPAPTVAVADAAAGVGVGTGSGATVLQNAQDALTPLAGMSSTIATIVAVLTVAGVVLTVGGIAYGWWARRKAAERADALDLAVPA